MNLIRRIGSTTSFLNEAAKPANTTSTDRRWAVSRANLYRCDLITKIVIAPNERAAFIEAFPDYASWFDETDDLKTAKHKAFDAEGLLNVELIPDV